jgi:hypothetical protein
MADRRAREAANGANKRSWIVSGLIVCVWVALFVLTVWLIWQRN